MGLRDLCHERPVRVLAFRGLSESLGEARKARENQPQVCLLCSARGRESGARVRNGRRPGQHVASRCCYPSRPRPRSLALCLSVPVPLFPRLPSSNIPSCWRLLAHPAAPGPSMLDAQLLAARLSCLSSSRVMYRGASVEPRERELPLESGAARESNRGSQRD